MLSFAACLLATSMAVGQAGKELPRDEHLQSLQPMIGTWAGKTALDQPIPGIAEKGDKVDFTIVYRYTPSGNAITVVVSITLDEKTMPVADGMFMWDPASQTVIGMSKNAAGDLSRAEVDRDGKVITLKDTGATAEGAKTSGKVIYTIVNRDERTAQLTDRTKGDDSIPDSPVISMKRVKRNQQKKK